MSISRSLANILGAVALAVALQAGPAHALLFEKFDAMNDFDQAEFVADMVDVTETVLKAEGNADWAGKIDHLFNTVLPGDKIAVGLAELDHNIARARLYDLQRFDKDPKATRLEVEHALFVTLKKNDMALSRDTSAEIFAALANFRPLTLAQFTAKPEAEQRHIVRLFSSIGYPEFQVLDEVGKRLKGEAVDDKDSDVRKDVAAVMKAQFPAGSGDQPGFVAFASLIAAESKKTPDDPGVLYQLVLFPLNAADTKLVAHMKEMDENTVVLPDGRSVYVDKNGDYWTWPIEGARSDNAQKLEGAERELAIKLADCRSRLGIKKGAEALIACKDEAGRVDSPSAPSPQSPPVDTTSGGFGDLIGEGGFIKPLEK